MDEQSRRKLTFYFSSNITTLSGPALLIYDQLINEHITDCIEIRWYIHREQALRKDNGYHGPG